MQQIARFDQELNYVPYRYRYRSTANPKEQSDGKEAGRYSRGKGERFNPQKYREERKIVIGNAEGRARMVGDEEQEWIGTQSHPLREEETVQQMLTEQLTQEDKQGQVNNPKANQRQIAWSPFEHEHFNDNLPLPRKSLEEQSSTEQYNKEIADLTQKISAEIEMNSIFNQSQLQEIKETILKNIQETQKNNINVESVRENVEKIAQEGFSNMSTQKEFEEVANNINTKGNKGLIPHQDKHLNQKRMEAIEKYKKKSPPSIELQSKRSQSNPTYAHHKNVKEKINFKTQMPRKAEQPSLKLQILAQFMPEAKQRAQFVRSPQKATTFESIQQQMTQLLIESQPSHLQSLAMAIHPSPESNHREGYHSQSLNIKAINIKEKLKERKVLAKEWKKKQIKRIEKKIDVEPLQTQQQPSQPAISQILAQFSKQAPNEAMIMAKQAKSREKASETITVPSSNPSNIGGYSISKAIALGYNSKNAYANKIKKDKAKYNVQQIPIKIKQQKQQIHSPLKMIQNPTQQQVQSPSQCSISQYSAVRKAKERSLHASSTPQQIIQQKSQSRKHEQTQRQFQLSYIESSIQINHAQHNPNFSHSKHQDYQYQQRQSKDRSISQHQQARSSRVGSDYIFSHPASYVHENPSPIGNSSIIKSQDGDELLKMMAINADMKEISSLVIEDKLHEMEEGQPFNHEFQGIIGSNESQYSPNSQKYSMNSAEIQRQFQEKVGDFELRDLLAMQRGERKENEDDDCAELQQINEDSQVMLQARGTNQIQDILFVNRDQAIQDPTPQASALQLQLDRLNNQTTQPQPSPLLLHRHFHPKDAIQRFKRSKHNSADCSKTPKSARFNFSLSLLKQSRLSNELEERWRGRLDRNIPRFKTRINDFY